MLNWTEYNTESIRGNKLFRFLSEKWLLHYVKSGSLWFSRADKFGDKLECVRLHEITSSSKPNIVEIEKRKRKHLICCFHEGTKESLAFWDTYSALEVNRRKYAVVFERNYLVNLINQIKLDDSLSKKVYKLTHGKVKYKTMVGLSDDKLKEKKVTHVAFRKEGAFAYEREYRFDIQLKSENKTDGIAVQLGAPSEIQYQILVNPLLKMEEYNQCINLLTNLKLQDKIRPSLLARWLKPELW
jgi:hypothetical protein